MGSERHSCGPPRRHHGSSACDCPCRCPPPPRHHQSPHCSLATPCRSPPPSGPLAPPAVRFQKSRNTALFLLLPAPPASASSLLRRPRHRLFLLARFILLHVIIVFTFPSFLPFLKASPASGESVLFAMRFPALVHAYSARAACISHISDRHTAHRIRIRIRTFAFAHSHVRIFPPHLMAGGHVDPSGRGHCSVWGEPVGVWDASCADAPALPRLLLRALKPMPRTIPRLTCTKRPLSMHATVPPASYHGLASCVPAETGARGRLAGG